MGPEQDAQGFIWLDPEISRKQIAYSLFAQRVPVLDDLHTIFFPQYPEHLIFQLKK